MSRLALVLLVVGCGRLDFDPLGASSDGSVDGAAAYAQIHWVQPFAQDGHLGLAVESFTAQPAAVGDAVVMQFNCGLPNVPSGPTVSAPGWSLFQISPFSGMDMMWQVTYGAIVPSTAPVQIDVTWPMQCSGVAAIGDEFANVDITGGATTFDGHVETTGTGDCAASLATTHPGDAVWAACSSYGEVTGVVLGFTKGADNADGDWTAYRTADDPVGSIEPGSFTNNLEEYTMEMVTLRPAAL